MHRAPTLEDFCEAGIDLEQFRSSVNLAREVMKIAGAKYALPEFDRLLALIDASPKAGSDARDAARWRYVRRKLCLTGNGDGTCGMQAINLPGSIPGWPDTSDDVVGFCEAAIDAAMQASA